MASKDEKAANDIHKSLLAAHGVEAPIPKEKREDTPQRVAFRGQAVLNSLESPSLEKITRVCARKVCGRYYTTNYYAVAYCSNECMQITLKEKYGLAWIPSADMKKERWEVKAEPEMIPMQALIAMKMIVSRVEYDLGHPIEYPELAFSQLPPGLLRPSEKKPSLASESDEELLSLLDESPLSSTPKDPAPKVQQIAEVDDLLASLLSG